MKKSSSAVSVEVTYQTLLNQMITETLPTVIIFTS